MRFFLSLMCTGAMLTVGCGGNDGKPPVPGPPVSDVKGSVIDVHVTEKGDTSSSRGPAQFEIAAVFPGEDGAPREILAAMNNDGTFVIPNVPEVPYDLRFVEFVSAGALPPRYIMNAPREIDLGRVFIGRADAAAIETTPTDIALTATGLEPWTTGDILEIFSPGSGSAGELLPTNITFPAEMTTSLDKYRVDTSQLLSPKLVDGSKGDTAMITQLAGVADLTAPYRSVRKVFEAPAFTQVDGMPTSLSGAFANVPQKTLAIGINASAYNAFSADVHPDAKVVGKNIRIIAEPGGERTTASVTPNLLICEAIPSATLPPSFTYGNPFPSAWTEVISTDLSFSMTHMAPSGVPKSTIVTIGQSGPAASFTTPAEPQLSPPINIKVNDVPAVDTVSGIGFSPMITFSPPSLGSPAVYIIAIRRLDPGGSTTRTTAIFSTTETTLRIPDGLLDFGYYYYFRITVRAKFDIAQPFKSGTTNAFASALTGILTP